MPTVKFGLRATQKKISVRSCYPIRSGILSKLIFTQTIQSDQEAEEFLIREAAKHHYAKNNFLACESFLSSNFFLWPITIDDR